MKHLQRLARKIDRGFIVGAVKLLHAYRYLLSPWIGNQCRFYPSCSRYSEEAFIQHGFVKGVYLTIRRLIKCHPWHPGGLDPVPPTKTSICGHSHSHSNGND